MRVFHRNESCLFYLFPSTIKEGQWREDGYKLVTLISMKNSQFYRTLLYRWKGGGDRAHLRSFEDTISRMLGICVDDLLTKWPIDTKADRSDVTKRHSLRKEIYRDRPIIASNSKKFVSGL